MSGINYMTQEGYDKLQAEVDDMKTRGRQEIAKAIGEAREKGDLSENAEYDAAKDAQGMHELRINELEIALSNARILSESDIDTSRVMVLCKVTIKNVANGMEVCYSLVSESESDLKSKKISVTSPIGKGLLGKKVGEIASITTPRGKIEFEIIDISI